MSSGHSKVQEETPDMKPTLRLIEDQHQEHQVHAQMGSIQDGLRELIRAAAVSQDDWRPFLQGEKLSTMKTPQ